MVHSVGTPQDTVYTCACSGGLQFHLGQVGDVGLFWCSEGIMLSLPSPWRLLAWRKQAHVVWLPDSQGSGGAHPPTTFLYSHLIAVLLTGHTVALAGLSWSWSLQHAVTLRIFVPD